MVRCVVAASPVRSRSAKTRERAAPVDVLDYGKYATGLFTAINTTGIAGFLNDNFA